METKSTPFVEPGVIEGNVNQTYANPVAATTNERKYLPWPKSFKRYLPVIAFDLLSIAIVLLLTYEFRRGILLEGLTSVPNFLSIHYDRVFFYIGIVLLVFTNFRLCNLYKHEIIVSRAKQIYLIAKSYLLSAAVVIICSFLFLNDTISITFRDFLILFTLVGIIISSIGRLLFRFLISNNIKLSTLKPAKKIVIIGAGQNARLYIAKLKNWHLDDRVVILDDDESKIGNNILGHPIVGKPEDVIFQSIIIEAEEIHIVVKNISKERLLEIIQICRRTRLRIKVMSSHFNLMFMGAYEKSDDLLNTIPIYSHGIRNKMDLVCKRIIDILGAALIGLLVLVPWIIISIIIKLTSTGPILHSSFRVGERGKLFKMYKFRSMHVNCENHHQKQAIERLRNGMHMGKVADDPRITAFGKILRKYNLDELPQLINVLKGEMSLVGPRPCFTYEMQHFEEWHHRRFLMKPGITGLWQVTVRQMDNSQLNDAMTTDVFYTDNHSIWMDFRILIRTIPLVLFGSGQ